MYHAPPIGQAHIATRSRPSSPPPLLKYKHSAHHLSHSSPDSYFLATDITPFVPLLIDAAPSPTQTHPSLRFLLHHPPAKPPTIPEYLFSLPVPAHHHHHVRLYSTRILLRPLPLDRLQVVPRLHHDAQALRTQCHPLRVQVQGAMRYVIDTLASRRHHGLAGTHLTDISSDRRVQAQGVSRLGEHDQALQQAGLHLLDDDSMSSFLLLLLSPTWLSPSATPPRRGQTPSTPQLDGTAGECHGTIPESTSAQREPSTVATPSAFSTSTSTRWEDGEWGFQPPRASMRRSVPSPSFNQQWGVKTTRQ